MNKINLKTNTSDSQSSEIALPSVTITIGLAQNDFDARKKILIGQAEEILRHQHEVSLQPLIEKLNKMALTINGQHGKKSAILYATLADEKTYYSDHDLQDSVIVDEPKSVRDIARLLNPQSRYLVLVQSASLFRVFVGGEQLTELTLTVPEDIESYKNDIAEKIEYFSDTADRREIMLDKFIHHIDKELHHLINIYKLPVFVAGPERMNGHFKKITHNSASILHYIHGNYDEAKPFELQRLLNPFLGDIDARENKDWQVKIEKAIGDFRFISGIENVWHHVLHNRGNVLLVERNFSYPDTLATGVHDHKKDQTHRQPQFLTDSVDIIIDKVLEAGGTVKFTDETLLREYGHIALFLYY